MHYGSIVCAVNSLVVNGSGASSKKTGVLVLLNALDSTRLYVGSYARDARLRPSRLSNKLSMCVEKNSTLMDGF